MAWALPVFSNPLGLAIDADDRIWINAYNPVVYRIDPSAGKLCTFSFDSTSDYIHYDGGFIWVADVDSDSIVRLNTVNNQSDRWSIGLSNFIPGGLDTDAEGNLWWADRGLDSLGRLNPELNQMTLYTTLEPCVMCAGAIIHARVKRVVYGATDPKTGAAGSVFNILNSELHNHRVDITSGVMEQECSSMLRNFFQAKRNQSS